MQKNQKSSRVHNNMGRIRIIAADVLGRNSQVPAAGGG